jgi:hypothetical protein
VTILQQFDGNPRRIGRRLAMSIAGRKSKYADAKRRPASFEALASLRFKRSALTSSL